MQVCAVVGLKVYGGNKKGDLALFQRESLVDAECESFRTQVLLVLLFLFQPPMRRIANRGEGTTDYMKGSAILQTLIIPPDHAL